MEFMGGGSRGDREDTSRGIYWTAYNWAGGCLNDYLSKGRKRKFVKFVKQLLSVIKSIIHIKDQPCPSFKSYAFKLGAMHQLAHQGNSQAPIKVVYHLFTCSGVAAASIQFCSVLLFVSTSQFLFPKELTLATVLSDLGLRLPSLRLLALAFLPSFDCLGV